MSSTVAHQFFQFKANSNTGSSIDTNDVTSGETNYESDLQQEVIYQRDIKTTLHFSRWAFA